METPANKRFLGLVVNWGMVELSANERKWRWRGGGAAAGIGVTGVRGKREPTRTPAPPPGGWGLLAGGGGQCTSGGSVRP